MNAPQKIAGFALGLAVVFATAFGFGAAFGPESAVGTTDHSQSHKVEPGPAVRDATAADLRAGLSSTEDGYTLELAETRADAGKQIPLRFRITDSTGAPVTRYVVNHEMQLHLIVVHVHPIGEPSDGITPAGPEIAFGATVPSDGDYRLLLDFKHENVVRTAEFTLSVDGGGSAAPAVTPADPGHSGH